jgi:predicted transcriptional regulator
MKHLGLKNRVYVLKEYVSPLVEEGLIVLTIPGKPRSPRQKYVVTKKGLAVKIEGHGSGRRGKRVSG